MRLQFDVDTSSTSDLAHLAILAGAFNGGSTLAAAPVKTDKPATAKPPAADKPAAPLKADTPATEGRITVEMCRTLGGTKKGVKAVLTDNGWTTLSEVPTEDLAKCYELFEKLPNK